MLRRLSSPADTMVRLFRGVQQQSIRIDSRSGFPTGIVGYLLLKYTSYKLLTYSERKFARPVLPKSARFVVRMILVVSTGKELTLDDHSWPYRLNGGLLVSGGDRYCFY